jgi:hypothetical protein
VNQLDFEHMLAEREGLVGGAALEAVRAASGLLHTVTAGGLKPADGVSPSDLGVGQGGSRQAAMEHLIASLRSGAPASRILVVDSPMDREGDRSLQRAAGSWRTIANRIVRWSPLVADRAAIVWTLSCINPWSDGAGIVVDLSHGQSEPDERSLEPTGVRAVLLPIYDDEGWLLWRRGSANGSRPSRSTKASS